MMNEEKLLTVARYLEGDMELQEKEKFEAAVQNDTELQTLIAEYKNVHQTLKMKIAPSAADQQVAQTLSSLTKQYFTAETVQEQVVEAKPVTLSLRPYLRWISVAAILIIGLLLWAPWSTGLYEKYATSKEMSVVERGDGAENSLDKAAEFYNSGDFVSASGILQKAYTQTPGDAMVAYYYGVSLIETNKTKDARVILEKIYEGASVFKYDAAYYIALSYVKEKNNAEALIWLAKVPQESNNYEKTQELTKKLK